MILAPAGGWLWATMIGAAIGLLFPSIMTMPLDVADRPADVGAMAALMLGAGYSVSAVAPFLLGVLRDAAGSFTVGMWVIFADTALMLVVVLMTSNERLRRRLEPGPGGRAPAARRCSGADERTGTDRSHKRLSPGSPPAARLLVAAVSSPAPARRARRRRGCRAAPPHRPRGDC